MPEFQEGELVQVTIRHAMVLAADGKRLHIRCNGLGGGEYVAVWPGDNIQVERVAPLEWPPQAGDVWRDRFGTEWFFYQGRNPEDGLSARTPAGGYVDTDAPRYCLDNYGPMALTYRPGLTLPATVSVPKDSCDA